MRLLENSMSDKKKLTDAQKQEELEDKIIYVESEKKEREKGSALASGGCGVCERSGFPIFLIRKSVISKDYSFPGDSGGILSLKRDKREPEANLSTHRYVYRTLRTGYVYVLVKNHSKIMENGQAREIGWEFLGYEVTPSGVYRHKSITDVKERNIKEIPLSCTNDKNHHISGAFITIDTSVHKGDAYIAYSRRAWSHGEKGAIDKYLDLINKKSIQIDLPSRLEKTITESDAFKRFTKISLTNEAFKDPEKLTNDGSRSFAFDDFETTNLLLELVADPKTIHFHDGQSIPTSEMLITAHKFNSLKDLKKDNNTYSYSDTTKNIYAKVKNFQTKHKGYKVPAVLIEDAFGIAEELSLQRQLKTEPIMQMIVNAESAYSEKLAASNESIVATSRIDQKLDEEIKEYRRTHSNEAEIMYDHKGRKEEAYYHPSGHTGYKDVGNYFLEDRYYKNYSSVIESGISYNYFNEKRLHLRKTYSLINEFRNQIESYEMNNAKDTIYYDYWTANEYGNQCFPLSNYYINKGYVSIEIDAEAKKNHLAEMSKGFFNTTSYIDVRAFQQLNTSVENAKKKIKKELGKYEKLLDRAREQEFAEQDKKEYEDVIGSIKKHSDDYFNYIIWLFGFSNCSEYAPTKIKSYNECYFWLLECDTNASNNHVGYLADFIKLIDYTCIGDVNLTEQYAIWDILLNNKDSIFYHLLDGSKDSLWELILELRLNKMKENLGHYTAADIEAEVAKRKNTDPVVIWNESVKRQEDASERLEKETVDILQELESKYASKLDEKFFWEKGRLMLDLYSMLIARASSGVANFPHKKEPSDEEKEKDNSKRQEFMKFFIQSSLVVKGDIICYFQLNGIPATDLHLVVKYFANDGIDDSSLPNVNYLVPDASEEETIDWDFIQACSDGLDLLIKLAEIGSAGDVFKDGKAFFQAFSGYVRMAPGSNALTRALMGGLVGSRFRTFRLEIANQTKEMQGKTPIQTIKDAGLNLTQGSKKEIAFASGKFFVAGVNSVINQISYSKNLEALEDSKIGETLREEIKRDVNFGFYKMVASYTNLANEALNLMGVSLPNALRTSIQTQATISSLTNGIFKITASAAAFMGVVTSLITIAEGFFIIQKGLKKTGTTRTMYVIAGGLQMLAGLAAFIQATGFLFFSGPIGMGLFLFSLLAGVAATIILYIFRDTSDDWNKQELWFNRCLFGLWEHQDKGYPYPPTYAGMALSINDYLVARMGINAVLQLEDKTFYAKKMGAYISVVKDHPGYDVIMEDNVKKMSKEIYLSLQIPAYTKNSIFDCSLRILHNSKKEPELVKLSIKDGDEEYPVIEMDPLAKSGVDFFVPRCPPLALVNEKTQNTDFTKVSKAESYGEAVDDKGNALGYFKVYYKIGEYLKGCKILYLQMQYWPNGKTTITESGKTVTNDPLLVDYKYID